MAIGQDPPACAAWRVTTRTQTSGALLQTCASGEAVLGWVFHYPLFSLLSSFDIIWHLVLGGGGERVPLRHRRPRRTCRLQSSAVEVQLHGKVYSHSNWKNAFNCKYEPWISSITVIVTIVSWCRYDPATDTWTMVANLSVGRDAIGDKQSLFVYLLMLMLMHFYSRRLCVG